MLTLFCVFFFQAEDGIRDLTVTGVQTCALPISQMLLTRGVEGFITTDTSLTEKLALPTVAVAGHERVENVTNIVLDHKRAARLALEHLRDLGHEEIAFIKGQTISSDSAVRWNAICEVAQQLEIRIRPELT